MRIALVCPYDMSRPGGVQMVVANLAARYRLRGHEVRIISPPLRSVTKIPGITPLGKSLKAGWPLGTSAEMTFVRPASLLDDLIADFKPEVLHVHEPWVPFLPRQIIARYTIPSLATFHALLPDTIAATTLKPLIRMYSRKLSPKICYVSAVSDPVAAQLKNFGIGCVAIIPNGIDRDPYRRKTNRHPLCEPSGPSILYVGRLEKRKGVIWLIKALGNFSEEATRKPRLIIAGDGPLRPGLQRYALRHGIGDIHFLGNVTEHDKIRLLKSCDLFCSPALFGESFGIVLIEAMAAGIPVIGGDNPGYRSVLGGAPHQTLIDPKDSSHFAELLCNVLSDQKMRRAIITWQNRQLKRYDYDMIADEYLALLARCAEGTE